MVRSCLCCCEQVTIWHLFFDCVVAKIIWKDISKMFGKKNTGTKFESVASWWLSDKRNRILNTVCAAVLWSCWNLRNDPCFRKD